MAIEVFSFYCTCKMGIAVGIELSIFFFFLLDLLVLIWNSAKKWLRSPEFPLLKG